MKRSKKLAVAGLVGIVCLGATYTAAFASDSGEVGEEGNQASSGQAKNVIFLIPDGFSQGYTNNYRLYKEDGEPIWDERNMLRAFVQTHSANAEVTDSAAAGTALATGEKTNNGMIGVTPDGQTLSTILDSAKENGKRTGLVATSTITHATPAAFAVSVESRNSYTEIASQMVANDHIDLMLGGGRTEFVPEDQGGIREDGVDLISEAEEKGFAFVETARQLANWDGEEDRLLGLFAEEALSPAANKRTDEPSLGEMTEKAIEFLSKEDNGFFLMVEGSQIDWAGHANDAYYAMTDTAAFEEAVEAAVDFADENGETLVVMVGDHDTGGMAVHASEEGDPSKLHSVSALGSDMAAEVERNYSNLKEVLETYTDFEWTEEELDQLKESDSLELAINTAISEKAGVAWSSLDHTGIDVPLYAYGAGAERFSGTIDNTEVPKIMKAALGI
ncbi:alkaline phosphatase [Shouchella clausii]|uniref:alkaline phosphatase n=1 Tax=Shouchella clausii TaxID=79880 RepID=UPI0031FBEF39